MKMKNVLIWILFAGTTVFSVNLFGQEHSCGENKELFRKAAAAGLVASVQMLEQFEK